MGKKGDFVLMGFSKGQAVALEKLLEILPHKTFPWGSFTVKGKRQLTGIRSQLRKKMLKKTADL